jgi:hypothetical protein
MESFVSSGGCLVPKIVVRKHSGNGALGKRVIVSRQAVSKFGGAGRAATRRASQREARHLEIRTLPAVIAT